jgi:hypothetical protein
MANCQTPRARTHIGCQSPRSRLVRAWRSAVLGPAAIIWLPATARPVRRRLESMKPAGRHRRAPKTEDQFAGRVEDSGDELLNAPTTGSTSGATAVRKAEAVSKSECFSGSSCGQRRQGSRGAPRNDDGLSVAPAPASRTQTAWGPTSHTNRGEGRPMPSRRPSPAIRD